MAAILALANKQEMWAFQGHSNTITIIIGL